MEEFINSLDEVNMQHVLIQSIKGKGAFGRFKTAIYAYKINAEWFHFHQERLKEMAIEWCVENRLAYHPL